MASSGPARRPPSARLARDYVGEGKRVGVVTNDQAHDLVDTNTFRGQGLAVEEVPGACFCCRFDDLVSRVGSLQDAEKPDVILAEPVGSCTDLVATVIQPLKDLYAGRFEVAPYAVLFKPSHGIRILKNQQAGGFSPKAAYIFKKQLEEADAILVNRIDEMSPPQLEELTKLLVEQFPGTPVLCVSAQTGQGFEALTELLEQTGGFGRKILDIDYDTYAEGEAELGWLNATARLTSAQPFDLDKLLTAILGELATVCRKLGGEVAHLKLIGMDDAGAFAVGNVVSNDTAAKLSLRLEPHAEGSGADRECSRGHRPGHAGSRGEESSRGRVRQGGREGGVPQEPESPPGTPGADTPVQDRPPMKWISP